MKLMNHILFKHPKNVCMTYRQHFNFSIGFSYILFIGSIKAFAHSIYPDIYVTSTGDLVKQLTKSLDENGCKKN